MKPLTTPLADRYPQGLRGIEPEVGRYDFDGASVELVRFAPSDFYDERTKLWRLHRIRPTGPHKTFSLAVYRYEPKKGGGVKRGPALARFRARMDRPLDAFRAAEAKCVALEAVR